MPADNSKGYLDGQLLLAMPTMADPRFERSVIYMCAHSAEGAMGIAINQPAENITFPGLLEQLNIITPDAEILLPETLRSKAVLVGGPVETGRGFVLHSADYFVEQNTLPIDEEVCLTATLDILKAIARGGGPKRSVLALGYAGWAAGQLESEIQANGWLTCPADAELIFGDDTSHKYERAMEKIGVDPAKLASSSGHA